VLDFKERVRCRGWGCGRAIAGIIQRDGGRSDALIAVLRHQVAEAGQPAAA
jgi:hypothetical protein